MKRSALGVWSVTLGQLLNPRRAWVRTQEQTSAVDVTEMSATKLPDQGGEAFFGHHALEALLKLDTLQ